MRYHFGPGHPLQPERVKLAVELIRERGLTAGAELVEPRQATEVELALCHSRGYIELVRMLSDPFMRDGIERGPLFEAGFGSEDNPVVDGMHEAAAFVAGGSLVAAESVHSGMAVHAFNPAGGLHHAA